MNKPEHVLSKRKRTETNTPKSRTGTGTGTVDIVEGPKPEADTSPIDMDRIMELLNYCLDEKGSINSKLQKAYNKDKEYAERYRYMVCIACDLSRENFPMEQVLMALKVRESVGKGELDHKKGMEMLYKNVWNTSEFAEISGQKAE